MNNENRAPNEWGGDNEVDNVVHMLSPLQFPRSGKRIDRAPLAAVAPDLYLARF